jgi:hypothetical protein
MKVGDKVRVKEGIAIGKIPEGRENNKTAIVRAVLEDIEGGVQTDRDLCGLRYWNAEDLEVVEGG